MESISLQNLRIVEDQLRQILDAIHKLELWNAACLILNKVDTKSLKKYGERTQRKPLCERH